MKVTTIAVSSQERIDRAWALLQEAMRLKYLYNPSHTYDGVGKELTQTEVDERCAILIESVAQNTLAGERQTRDKVLKNREMSDKHSPECYTKDEMHVSWLRQTISKEDGTWGFSTPGWYFWEDDGTREYGPYEKKDEAIKAAARWRKRHPIEEQEEETEHPLDHDSLTAEERNR